MNGNNNKDYIGDGVYVIHEGYGIWLHANHPENPTDRIWLEGDMLEKLVKFDKRIKSEMGNK
jgi:hypothetical protein